MPFVFFVSLFYQINKYELKNELIKVHPEFDKVFDLFDLIALSGGDLFDVKDHEVNIIGTRHGEKLYETLLSREEMACAIDMDQYYRIPPDNRDLNYGDFFEDGNEKINQLDDYFLEYFIRLLKRLRDINFEDIQKQKNLII